MRIRLSVLVFIAAVLAWSDQAEAAQVGNWVKICVAPNWMTGVPEQVPDQNIADPNQPFWGFTQKLVGGHWATFYNLALINPALATNNVLKFLVYHECAHAKLNTSDEHLADCQGLADMQQEVGLSAQAIQEITMVYNSRGRAFPSGGAC